MNPASKLRIWSCDYYFKAELWDHFQGTIDFLLLTRFGKVCELLISRFSCPIPTCFHMCLLNHFSPFLPWSFVIARFLFWHGFRSLLSYTLEGKTEWSVVYRLSQLHWHIKNMNYYPAELHWMLKIGAPNYKLLGIFYAWLK